MPKTGTLLYSNTGFGVVHNECFKLFPTISDFAFGGYQSLSGYAVRLRKLLLKLSLVYNCRNDTGEQQLLKYSIYFFEQDLNFRKMK